MSEDKVTKWYSRIWGETLLSDKDRCIASMRLMPDAIQGRGGSDATLKACCEIHRYGLNDADAFEAAVWWSENKSRPKWSVKELKHKLADAKKKVVESGKLGVYAGESKDDDSLYECFYSYELDELEFEDDYIIEDMLVAGEPLIIAGPPKSLKTSIAMAAAVSLASGTPFLGKFKVPKRKRVLMMTGESGLRTLQKTQRRVAKANDLVISQDLTELVFSAQLPRFGSDKHIEQLRNLMLNKGTEVLIVDPVYLAMPGADAGNLMIVGELLRSISDICQEIGVTLILIHHTKKNRLKDGPPNLTDIAWAGFAEFCRQWWIVMPTKPMQHGVIELRMSVGGSAGHFGDYTLTIDESKTESGERRWETEIIDTEEAEVRALLATEDSQASHVMTVLRGSNEPMTVEVIATETGMERADAERWVAQLSATGELEVHQRNGSTMYGVKT